jgi:hypothetical protein
MATVKERQKIKIQCDECKKTLVSWWFVQNSDGNFSNICKYCQHSDDVYKCIECKAITPYKKMLINRGNIQTKCKACDSKGSKKRYSQNRKGRLATVKAYAQNNPNYKIYQKWYHSQPHQRIRGNLHKRIYQVLQKRNTEKSVHTISYLGCSLEFFLAWLEFRFTDGMEFDNYGEWHMDHCKPCNAFDLLQIEEQMKCFHWTNIQPMWGPENISKSDNYSEEELIAQQEKVAAFKLSYFGENPDEELLSCSIGEQEVEVFYYHPDSETDLEEPQGNLIEEFEPNIVQDINDIVIQNDVDLSKDNIDTDSGHGQNIEELGNQQPNPIEYYSDLDD